MFGATTPRTGDTLGPFEILSPLGQGGMGVVYRARHRDTDAEVALKTVRLPRARSLESLRREIRALARLRHPGIVRIVDHGVEAGLPWYAMDLFEGEPLSGRVRTASRVAQTATGTLESADGATAPAEGAPLPMQEAITIIRRLCAPLAYLHGEGLVHGDLKTSNVLLTRDGRVVICDFGLAARFKDEVSREALQLGHGIAGTAAYMSPEQIRGELLDARADLYALGCILFELLTGQHPFSAFTVQAVLEQHLSAPPPRPSVQQPQLPPPLDALVDALMRKERAQRIGHADIVARRLGDLGAGGDTHGPAPRPYLYRPGLVGRAPALSQADAELEALSRGRGGLLLIAGESGLGKTRFAIELGRRARKSGARVLAGECRDRGGQPLEGLRKPLQRIADHCRQLEGAEVAALLGPHARVLAQYAPELLALRQVQALPEPAMLAPDAARLRLFDAAATTLFALAARRPQLLILDDLQWADQLTLDLLAWLLRSGDLEDHPVLIVGTWRSEEQHQALGALLSQPGIQHIRLQRLGNEEVRSVVRDMLGTQRVPEKLTQNLAAQSEGNPFFIAEYLRAAVDEAMLTRDGRGAWQAEAGGRYADALPESLQTLVARRLSGLTPLAQRAVGAAAVAGRELSGKLLAAMLAADESTLLATVDELRRRGVIDAPGATLRFSHDKLREVAYAALDDAQRRRWHRRAAEHISAQPGPPAYAMLAHHWSAAGVTERAVDALDGAGTQALDAGAYGEAEKAFERALRHSVRDAEPRRARWHRQLAEACMGAGRYREGRAHLQRSLRALGHRPAARLPHFGAGLVQQMLTQAAHRRRPPPLAAGPEAHQARDAARAYQRLLETYWFDNDTPRLVDAGLRALNCAERAGPSPELVRAYATMCVSAGSIPVHSLAEFYAASALTVSEQIGDAAATAYALFLTSVYRVGTGAWPRVEADLERAAALCADIGDARFHGESLTVLGMAALYRGDFPRADALFAQVREAGRRSGNLQHRCWGAIGGAEVSLRAVRFEEAEAALRAALERVSGEGDAAERMRALGLLAVLRWTQGRHTEALEDVAEAETLRARFKVPAAHYLLEGYAGIAEVRVRQAAEGGDAELARRAVSALSSYARVFAIGRPRAARWRAALAELQGRERRARQHRDEARRSASALQMRWEADAL